MCIRFSVKSTCLVVALAAAECALFVPGSGEVDFGILLNTVALPMLSILLYVSRRQRRLDQRGRNVPHLRGFQLAGAASLAIVVAALVFVPWVYGVLIGTFDPARQLVLRLLGFRAETYTMRNIVVHWCAELSLYLSISFVLTIVMLLIAAIGEWLGPAPRST